MKILVADDTPAILDVLRQILETEGYDVVTAPDGQEVQMGVQSDADGSLQKPFQMSTLLTTIASALKRQTTRL